MCGLSTVVTPAGASLTMYREIRSYANSIWDDNSQLLYRMKSLYLIVVNEVVVMCVAVTSCSIRFDTLCRMADVKSGISRIFDVKHLTFLTSKDDFWWLLTALTYVVRIDLK